MARVICVVLGLAVGAHGHRRCDKQSHSVTVHRKQPCEESTCGPRASSQCVLRFPSLPHRPQRTTCAVVGSGAGLYGSRCGAAIDAHDLVFRCNSPVTGGKFARDVGTRTHVTVVNAMLTDVVMSRKDAEVPVDDHRPLDARGGALILDIAEGALARRKAKLRSPSDYGARAYWAESRGFRQSLWSWWAAMLRANGTYYGVQLRHVYSTGVRAVLHAVTMCDKVTIYGYKTSQDARGRYHYWSNASKREWLSPFHRRRGTRPHEMALEHRIFAGLRRVALCPPKGKHSSSVALAPARSRARTAAAGRPRGASRITSGELYFGDRPSHTRKGRAGGPT